MTRYRPALYAAARAIERDESRAREIADSVYADLYGMTERGGERRSLLGYYHGRSSLRTWLHAVVSRAAVDAWRRVERARETAVPAELPSDDPPPNGSSSDRARLLSALREALAHALAKLDPRDRLRLAYHYRQGLTLAEIGLLVGEHESTVSRRLERVRRQIRKEVDRALRREKNLSAEEIQECYAYATEEFPFEVIPEER